MPSINIERRDEFAISSIERDRLRNLLDECFPNTFAKRTYYKQLPHWRLLAFEGDDIVGQVGVDARVIRVGEQIVPIFGLVDLAVRASSRRLGIGGQLLKFAGTIAQPADIEFLVLMADRHEIYIANGFHPVQPAVVKWLAIEDRRSHSLIQRDLSDCFLTKPLTSKLWPSGPIDMLGYLF